jgi:hypothetical protein
VLPKPIKKTAAKHACLTRTSTLCTSVFQQMSQSTVQQPWPAEERKKEKNEEEIQAVS